MTAIQATSAGVKDLADGSLRITLEFGPADAAAAFELFGARGTPIAVARINPEVAKADLQDKAIKGGPLSILAGRWCQDPKFWEWLETSPNNACHSERGAALCLYSICGIESRAELDHNPQAAEKFHRLIREPFSEYLKEHQ